MSSPVGRAWRIPPRRAEAFLVATLPEGVLGVTIIGDLHQDYEERADRFGRLRLWLWYWIQALELGGRYLLRSLRRETQLPGYRQLVAPPPHNRSDQPPEELMDALFTDARYAVRMLLKTPMVSLIATFTMALGIAITVFTFSNVYGSVMRGVPIPDDEGLLHIQHNDTETGDTGMWSPIHDYLDYRDQSNSFQSLAGLYQGTVNLAGDDTPPERYQGAFMSANGLSLVGVPPLLGRTFVQGEDEPEASPVIVIGHGVWQNRFGGDRDIVGRTIQVNGEAAEIIGVMPEGFRFPFDEDVWVTHRIDAANTPRRDGHWLDPYGRLQDGVSREQAAAEIAAINQRLRAKYPDEQSLEPYLIKHEERYMPPQITAVLWLQLGAVFGVLLIACANVANLLLARAAIRGREMAVRTALGASRSRVIRQLLVESLVLATIAGIIGLVAAKFGIDAFNAAILDIQKPYWIEVSLDGVAVAFTLTITLVAALGAGLLPAVRASGGGAGAILKDESRGTSLRLGRLSSALVITEVAVSCVLLILAGMMIKSVINVNTVDLGFRTEGIVSARVGLFAADYPERVDREVFFDALVTRLRSLPGVEHAALTNSLPGTGARRARTSIEGEQYERDGDYPVVNMTLLSSGFFDLFDVPILQGRDFRPSESNSSAEPVVIVNESFVRRFFPDEAPLGRRIRVGTIDADNPWLRVVGVVPDLHVGGGVGGIGSDRQRPEHYYLSMGSLDSRFATMVVRTDAEPTAVVSSLRATVTALDPNIPIYSVATMDQALQTATWAFDMFGGLFSLLGVSAMFLAAVGLYGVMAFSVTQRTRELGIRMALGAGSREVMRLVLRKGALQLGLGLAIGLVVGALAARPLRVVTFGVETSDPTVYLAIILTILVPGLIATLVPARRASRVDPATALRVD